jgi:putative DNA-invertase from lambdoid prophage Rac
MRCAIYCRVSTDDQNLDRQVDELREYAARMRWELVGEYSDRLSGAQRSRPGLDAMMAAAEQRDFDILTVWALDRVGRSTLHTLEVVEKLDALGIHFRSYTQGAIDTTSPTGKLVLTILAGVAEMERSQIRERVRSGLAAAKKRGVRLGQQPLEEVVVERVRALADSGMSVRKIADQVSTRRLPVSKSSVQRILAGGVEG